MRLPLFRPYRMFPQFDHLSDSECEKYVRDAYINTPGLTAKVPIIAAVLATALWYIGWPIAFVTLPLASYVPMPPSAEWRLVAYIVLGVAFVSLTYFLTRDLGVYFGIRRELRRSNCRKCGQSLQGLPIHSAGADPDPAKQFVRCTECGRRWVLLDLGLSPRDLIPFEQRVVDSRVATRR